MKDKHLFFDLDGTITHSREIISPRMKKVLLSLNRPLIVISGAEQKRILKQMDGVPCVAMGQQGNEAPDWYNKLTNEELKEIEAHIQSIPITFSNDCVQYRGCQVSLSFTGHHANLEWKKHFDPYKKFRRKILQEHPFNSKTLTVRIAGTTCLDYNRKKSLKGDNLKRYMKLHKLNPKDCIYYGDNFNKEGNDYSVKGVMKCVKVNNPNDLLKKL